MTKENVMNAKKAVKYKKNKATSEMVEAIKAAVYAFAGKVSVAEAFGAMSIAKVDLEKELLN